jgi:two-component system, NarL family, response regulator NreC
MRMPRERTRMRSLRLLLADDHGVMRAGLRALLDRQPGFEVAGEAESADEAVALAVSLRPSVAILDVRMPGGGLEATERIKRETPEVAVLLLSQYDDPAYLRAALIAGASGYALKRSSGAELVEAIRAVARGEMYLHPSLARVLVQDALASRHGGAPAGVAHEALSERESQVVRLVALGHTSQHIAEQLFLSVRTVETYKSRAMEKLGLHGRAALVQYALENGLLEPGEADY